MKLLELMSGTGSVGRAFKAVGWEVVSLDFDPKSGADIIADVCTWEPDAGATAMPSGAAPLARNSVEHSRHAQGT